MTSLTPGQLWLSRLRHDLVKRLLWPARDCKEFNRTPEPGELTVTLFDGRGHPTSARGLWEQFRDEAPRGFDLDAFTVALVDCVEAADRGDWQSVLDLEEAFERLRVSGNNRT